MAPQKHYVSVVGQEAREVVLLKGGKNEKKK